jgi:hypothetical protein
MENSQQTCAKRTPPRQWAEIPMTHNLMNCSVTIHCTLVVRNIVMVACAEPWFIHALAKRRVLAAASFVKRHGECLRQRAGDRFSIIGTSRAPQIDRDAGEAA